MVKAWKAGQSGTERWISGTVAVGATGVNVACIICAWADWCVLKIVLVAKVERGLRIGDGPDEVHLRQIFRMEPTPEYTIAESPYMFPFDPDGE